MSFQAECCTWYQGHTGFFDEVADRIPYEFIRKRVHAVINQRLGLEGEGTAL